MREVVTKEQNPRVRDPQLWECEDEQGSELEVSGFLLALVRLLKPLVVVETGCYTGQSTKALVAGVVSNGVGKVWSCDTDSAMIDATVHRLGGLDPSYNLFVEDGEKLISRVDNIDFAFIDSGNGTERQWEIIAAAKKLNPYGIIALHDTYQPRYPDLGMICFKYGLTSFYMNCPRGLTLFQKAP